MRPRSRCVRRTWIRSLTLGIVVFGFVANGGARAQADPATARAMAARAEQALRDGDPVSAADWFERADAASPHAIWALAAGEALLAAGRIERARERLESAIARGLEPAAHERAVAKRAVVVHLATTVTRASALDREGDHLRAMGAWQEAFDLMPIPAYLVSAARAADAAHRDDELARLAELAGARPDVTPDDRRWLASIRHRLEPPKASGQPAVRATSTVAPWVVIGSGVALIAGGAVALWVGDGFRSDLASIKSNATDGVVFTSTRRSGEDLQDKARAWTVGGLIGIGLGTVTAGLGTGWLVAASGQRDERPPRDASALTIDGLSLTPLEGRGVHLGARASFR